MDRKIMNIVKRVMAEGSDKMCSECSGRMMEGQCMECGMTEGEIEEKLHGKQYKLDKNKNGKIDKNDFAMIRRKKSEMKEGSENMCECGGYMKEGECMECGMTEGEIEEKLHGKQYKLDKNKNGKLDSQDFKMLRKESYELVLDETGEKFIFTENEIINIIENIILEEKKKSNSKNKSKTKDVFKDAQKKSKKQNDDYIGDVVKKMKDYLKDASKGDYEMEPKHFPKGNGELAKMSKHAYTPSDTTQEYIDNFTAAGLENLDFDDIHPNEEWMDDLLQGSSRTGNNPEWANAVETPSNKKRNQIRKDNLLRALQRKAYQKDPQPVKNDTTGEGSGDGTSKLIDMLKSSKKKTKTVKENFQINENVKNNIMEIKKLIGYQKKTQ
jgi:hypothetical protein